MKRYAVVALAKNADPKVESERIARYMPGNYEVLGVGTLDEYQAVVIGGEDNAGWTLDDYVLPRLGSGLYLGREIDLSHPIMKQIPDARYRTDGIVAA